jgi:hypothetical protein
MMRSRPGAEFQFSAQEGGQAGEQKMSIFVKMTLRAHFDENTHCCASFLSSASENESENENKNEMKMR